MTNGKWLTWALAAAVFSGFVSPAGAQGRDRKGFFAGGSVGLGNSSPDLCVDCDTGLAVDVRLGAMLKPRLGVLAQFGGVSSAPTVPSEIFGRHKSFLAALQYWPSRRLWLKAGAGAGSVERINPPAHYDYSTTHFGGLAGIGFEINPGSAFVVELALCDFLSGDGPAVSPFEPEHKKTVNSVIFTVGLTWYHR